MTVLTRVAALVVAVGLVVAAVLVRTAREGNASAGRGGLLQGASQTATCVEELQDLCLQVAPEREVAWSPSSARPVRMF